MENRRLETAVKMAVRQRNYQRVRARALVRLAKAHREEYKIYLEEEKNNDHTQGKTWTNLNGNTSSSLDPNTSTLTSRGEGEDQQANYSTRTGDL